MKSMSTDSRKDFITDTISSMRKTFDVSNSLITKLRSDLKKPILREVRLVDFEDDMLGEEECEMEEMEHEIDSTRRSRRGVKEIDNDDLPTFFMFEVTEMFSPETKEFFDANYKRRMNVAEKTKTVSRFIDRMLEWDDVCSPLVSSFWVELSATIGRDPINEESILKIEDKITKRLSDYNLTMRTYLDQFYPKQNEL